ncbi:MAG: hypothetical protein LAN83_00910 [Acidobacteriia bacterium]|nr:hypothetical protein [Terriglobia bacterium]
MKIRETRQQQIARLQAGAEPPQQTFCQHGQFKKRTEVDAGDGKTVIHAPCAVCFPNVDGS